MTRRRFNLISVQSFLVLGVRLGFIGRASLAVLIGVVGLAQLETSRSPAEALPHALKSAEVRIANEPVEGTSFIVSPSHHRSARVQFEKTLRSLKTNGWSIRPLFRDHEKRILTQLKLDHLSSAVLIERDHRTRDGRKPTDDAQDSIAHSPRVSADAQPYVRIEPNQLLISLADQAQTEPNGTRLRADFDAKNSWRMGHPEPVSIALTGDQSLLVNTNSEFQVDPKGQVSRLRPARKVRVAVIDSGLDVHHPNLVHALAKNTLECEQIETRKKFVETCRARDPKKSEAQCQAELPQIEDADGNGFPLDCWGWNFAVTSGQTRFRESTLYGNSDVSDRRSHGTHVAGLIAAHPSRDITLNGVSSSVELIPIKTIDETPNNVQITANDSPLLNGSQALAPYLNQLQASPSDRSRSVSLSDLVSRALLYAVNRKAQVINFSMGWPANSTSAVFREILDAVLDSGVLVVASALNDASPERVMPCAHHRVLCVASHDPDGSLSSFSNSGPHVDVSAPGRNLLSTVPLGNKSLSPILFLERLGFDLKSGTSMSAPLVSGSLAELMARGSSPQIAQARLLAAADSVLIQPNKNGPERSSVAVQTGALRLDRAVSLSPRPLLYPADKSPRVWNWQAAKNRIQVPVPFVNLWAKAAHTEIELSLDIERDESVKIIGPRKLSFSQWNPHEVKTLSFVLEQVSPNIDSELVLKFTITSRDQASGQFYTQRRAISLMVLRNQSIEVPLGRQRAASDPVRFAVDDTKLPESIVKAVRGSIGRLTTSTVRNFDRLPETDFIVSHRALVNAVEQKFFVLYSRLSGSETYEAKGYHVQTSNSASRDGLLIAVDRVDLNLDGRSEYVFLWLLSPTVEIRRERYVFEFFDHDLRPFNWSLAGKSGEQVLFDPVITLLSPQFSWAHVGTKRRMSPVWVSRGRVPAQEFPAYDPYDPTPNTLPLRRLYTLTDSGLRTIEIDKTNKVRPLGILRSSRDDVSAESGLWLVGQGRLRDGRLNSELMLIKPGSTEVTSRIDVSERLDLELREDQVKIPMNLNSQARLGFAGFIQGRSGRIRTASIELDPSQFESNPHSAVVIQHRELRPDGLFDSAINVPSFFIGQKSHSLFFESRADVYAALEGDKHYRPASRKTYTFLNSQFRFELIFGAVRKTADSGLQPALYKAAGLTLNRTAEIYAIDSQRQAVTLPAQFRINDWSGCQSNGSLITDPIHLVSMVTQFCGDSIVFVPIADSN